MTGDGEAKPQATNNEIESSILRLSNASNYHDQQQDATDNETDNDEDVIEDSDDEGLSAGDKDIYILLGFQERSLRQYFCKDEAGSDLRSPPNLGHMMIFEGITAILTSGNINAEKSTRADRLLIQYATQHWMKHLLEIRCRELDDAQAARVIEGLQAILSNRNNALKFFEFQYRSEDDSTDSYSIFGSKSEDHDKARDALKEWATRAISLSSSTLAPGTAEWMRPLVRNPDVAYVRIAEAHVANWFINPRNDFAAYKAFLFAHNALERGKKLLKPQSELHKYFTEREESKDKTPSEKAILAVPNFFWQLQMTMTAQCYRAIGMALKSRGFYEASLVQCEEALKFADDDRDMLQVYSTMGETLVSLAQKAEERKTSKEKKAEKEGFKTEGDEAKGDEMQGNGVKEYEKKEDEKKAEEDKISDTDTKEASTEPAGEKKAAESDSTDKRVYGQTNSKTENEPDVGGSKADAEPSTPETQTPIDWAAKASETLAEAAKLIPRVASVFSADVDKDIEIKNAVVKTYVMRAKAELLRGRSENLIAYMTGAIEVPCRNKFIEAFEFVEKLASQKEWHRIVELIKILHKGDRFNVLWAYWNSEQTECVHRAGKETGELQLVIDEYESAVRLLATWNSGKHYAGYLLLPLAIFLRTVVGGDQARARAKQLLAKTLDVSENADMLSAASFEMADVLVDDFRSTRDPVRKMTAQAEMKALAARVRENMGADFDYTQSQLTIPLAYMTRRLHAVEFQRGLEATFQGCVELLRDSTAVNDSPSLRTLARVLAYVPGLDRDAGIAATCQLYILDMELQKREDTAQMSEDEDEDSTENGPTGEKNGDKAVEKQSEAAVEEKVEGGKEKSDAAKAPNGGETQTTTSGAAPAETEATGPVLTNGTSTKAEDEAKAEKSSGEAKTAAEEEALNDYDPNYKLNIGCKNCRKIVYNWNKGAMYLCYYCTELDMCEEVSSLIPAPTRYSCGVRQF